MPEHKRLLSMLAANLLAVGLTTAYAATYEVTASVLNVRSGPGTAYAISGKLVRGDTVEVKTIEGPWALISLGGERVGYVSSSYIAATDAAAPAPVETSRGAVQRPDDAVAVMAAGVDPDDLPPGATQGMVMSNSLNFRAEASADSPLIESLPYGTVVEIVLQGEAGGWHYVSFNSVRGYVYADYVRLADADGRFFGLADDVIAYAKKFLGYRYVYGGSTPSGGFDCGGLIKYVFGQFGYSLNMGATTQYRSIPTHLSREQLRPGDIVYFSSPGNRGIAHTGIYLGDNLFIHASSPGDVVKITSMASGYYDKYYYGAARLIV
ncbi:MAG TPA: NlpC/P60 family protein [Candidatus Acidoferrum sp.]|nr:NlpC/P60 family protein [Candidatus Acidoferrum sp.]